MRSSRVAATVLALLLLSPLPAAAADYGQMIDQFLASVKAGKSGDGLDALYRTNPWMSRASDQVQKLKTQLASLEGLVGELKNYERLQEVAVGTRYVHVTYLVLYDRQPVRFEFKFFKPAGSWAILGFAFDDKFDEDVEEFAHRTLARK